MSCRSFRNLSTSEACLTYKGVSETGLVVTSLLLCRLCFGRLLLLIVPPLQRVSPDACFSKSQNCSDICPILLVGHGDHVDSGTSLMHFLKKWGQSHVLGLQFQVDFDIEGKSPTTSSQVLPSLCSWTFSGCRRSSSTTSTKSTENSTVHRGVLLGRLTIDARILPVSRSITWAATATSSSSSSELAPTKRAPPLQSRLV